MFVDTTLNVRVPLVNAGTTMYGLMPYRGRVIDVMGAVQGATSDANVNITLTAPSHGSGVTLGVVNFVHASSGNVTAKDVGTYTPNTTTGMTVLSAGSIIQFAVASTSIGAVTTAAELQVVLSPY